LSASELALDGAFDFVDKARGVPILAQRLRLIADQHERGRPRDLSRGLRLDAPCRLHRRGRRKRLPGECPLQHQGIRRKFQAVDADFAEIENYQAFGYRWPMV
jgi:hypothetical protein